MKWTLFVALIFSGFRLSAQSVSVSSRAIYDFFFIDNNPRLDFENIALTDGKLFEYEHSLGDYKVALGYMNNYNHIYVPVVNDSFYSLFGNTISRSHVLSLSVNKMYILYGKLSFGWSAVLRGVWINRIWEDSDNCNIVQLDRKDYQACNNLTAYTGFKIEPSANIFFDFAFLDRMHMYIYIGITKGFSRYQEMEVRYRYKGIDQESVTSYTNGTGLYFGTGLKFDIVEN